MIRRNKKVIAMQETVEDYQKQIRKLQNELSKFKNISEIEKRETQRLIDEYTIKIEILNASNYNNKGDADNPIIVHDEKVMDSRTTIQRHLEAYMQKYFPNLPKEKAQTFYMEMCKEIQEDCEDRMEAMKSRDADVRND